MAGSSKKSAKKRKANPSNQDAAQNLWAFRRPERQILSAAMLMIFLGFLSILGSRHAEVSSGSSSSEAGFDFNQWIMLLIWVGCIITTHLVMLVSRSKSDPVMVGIVLCLAGFGILAQYRMKVYEGVFTGDSWQRPGALAFPIGIILMVITHQLFRNGRYLFLKKVWPLWLIGSLGVVGYVIYSGERFRGAIMLSGNLTPTEVLKLFIPLTMTGFLLLAFRENKSIKNRKKAPKKNVKRKKKPSPSKKLSPVVWLPMGISMLVILGGLVYQRDLGMVLILCVSIGFQIFAGIGIWWILPLMGAGLVIAVAIVQNQFPHALARFDVWFNPFSDPRGDGWQILQSFSGMYSGGLWGEGWGQGDPERIPIANSDFIYSVIGEEMGFLGCFILIILMVVFINRAYRVTEATPDDFGRILGSGLVSVLAVQMIVNIGGVVKVLPLTGVPLNFVSHGGTSLVTSFVILGLILALNDSQKPVLPDKKPKLRQKTKA